MANIRVFEQVALQNRAPIRMGRTQTVQEIAIGATSDQSAAFGAGTDLVSIQADADCHVVFGANPTATTAGWKVLSGATMDFHVCKGDKVAVIQA